MFFFTALAIVSTITLARSAYAAGADDVFMDEGDGDFDAAPTIKSETEKAPAPVEAPKAVVTEPRPALEPAVTDTTEVPTLVDDQAAPAAPAPTDDPAAPVASEPKEKKAKKKSSKKKLEKTAHHKSKVLGPNGGFVVTKEACPMMRTPASTGETMLTVKPSRKIWVEQAGDEWVKGWNKAGEPGYISKDCVE